MSDTAPDNLSKTERLQLIKHLNALLPVQFEELLYALKPPSGIVPGSNAAQGDRVSALMKWVEGPTGPGLSEFDRVLKQTTGISITSVSEGTDAQAIAPFTLPYERNPFFTGRDELLTTLRDQLTGSGTAALSQPAALSGLGGIGKTETAIEYAHRYRDTYKAIFWVRAETDEELISGFVALAEVLQLPERKQQDQQKIVNAVIRWITTHDDWLLIFDNADELNLLRPYWPKDRQGHILITTRAQAIGTFGQRVELRQMSTEEGATFLLRRSRILLNNQTLDDASETDQHRAKEITSSLGGLPLALDQAGAYMEEMGIGLDTYQELYEQEGITLLEERGELTGDHDPVTITFSLAFKKVAERNAAAADLLKVCAFLAPDAIPKEIFVEGRDALGDTLAADAKSSAALTQIIATASKFSLVYRNIDAKTLDMHRLVQEVLREEMDEAERKEWANRAMEAVNSTFSDAEFESWETCDRLLSHATTVLNWQKQYQLESESTARLLDQTAVYVYYRGRYDEAEPLYQKALAMRERLLGEENSDVANNLLQLGYLYTKQGRYGEAELLYQKAQKIYKQLLGEDHYDVVRSLHFLAALYDEQGRYSEAEPLLRKVLTMSQRLLGEEHPDVANSLSNLAALYYNQGRYSEVELLYKQALEMRQRLLGEDHPDVAANIRNLGQLYRTQGRYSEAEPLYKQALEMRQRLLGEEHPDVADSLDTLALLYDDQGRHSEAEPLYKQSLEMRQRLLGEEHPDVAASLHNLAKLYYNQGRYSESESYYQESLAMDKRLLGDTHPYVGRSLDNLAMLYVAQDDIKQARLIFTEALEILENALGIEHPWSVRCRENLAQVSDSDC